MQLRALLPALPVTFVLALAPAAAAVPLSRTSTPLPGSSFQGADGNQTNDSGFIDWQQLQAEHRVVHSPDPEPPDSSFTGDSEDDKPEGWGLTTGGVPNKANIQDVWSGVDQPGADTFLYFSFRRETETGDTHLALELNRDPQLWNNGQALIPCRRSGDLAVAYDVGTNTVNISIQRWKTATFGTRGCARTGSFTTAADISPVDVQAAMSPRSITNYLPGAPALLAAGAFGEAALNLAALARAAFGDQCLAFESAWMHTRSSESETSSMQDYVAPQPLSLRTCSASGTKFFDLNGNAARDPGEPGIPRFLIWADYNNDGVRNPGEPFSVTDDDGDYVIDDIHGTYRLREMLLDGRTNALPFAVDWECSYPTTTAPGGRFPCAWGPIDANATPNATALDFGNLYPAQLTIRKNVEPPGDSTQFQVNVTSADGALRQSVSLGDGGSQSIDLPPGSYNVEEQSGGGYTTSVTCRNSVARRGTRRPGAASGSVTLAAGAQAECAFVNVKDSPAPVPAIQIVKTGPATATAGDTLAYALYVTNSGQVSFPASGLKVTDPACDRPPKLDSKNGDPSPGTLDPNETWTYKCSNATPSGGANCTPANVPNTATATGDTGTSIVTDSNTITTELSCPPPQPPEPQPVEPVNPDNPDGPVEPDGPPPPDANDSGGANIKVLPATAGCARASKLERVNVSGTRIASIRIYANGHFVKKLTPHILQQQSTVSVRLAPGRYRVTAHVSFQPGSSTPPVVIAQGVRICAARAFAPVFTG